MANSARLQVTLVYSPLGRDVRELVLELGVGSTVCQALQSSGLLQMFPLLEPSSMTLGVWGRKASLKQPLRQNDRIEIYRPLNVDPKVARRERFVRQGAGSAGLFEKRRAGAKAGY